MRTIAAPDFAGDHGEASIVVREALAKAASSEDVGDYLNVVALLCTERLLVPVVATETSSERSASAHLPDKEAEMSVVFLQNSDGRRALLAFTGLDSLQQWQPAARPVPVTLDVAARAALSEGGSALLVDCAGPASLLIEEDVLAALARGHRLLRLENSEFGWMIPGDVTE